MSRSLLRLMVVVICSMTAPLAFAQTPGGPPPAVEPDEGITILFETGRAELRNDQLDRLDRAARLFRDGNPIVMVITGTADTIGPPSSNLDLSIDRARAVARGLVARGIPIERLQILGQGNSELPVPTEDNVAKAENRSARITWR